MSSSHPHDRRVSMLLPLLAACAAFIGAPARAAGAASSAPGTSVASSATVAEGRVIVLGFDGADATTVEELMDAGQLPNLARLREQGTFAPLASTVPSESPVSWASLNSGQNPAKTNVQGFVKRALDERMGPIPALGLRTIEDRPIEAFELGALRGFLAGKSPALVGTLVGVAVLVLFLLVFLMLLRIKARVSIVLSMLLGGVGAWGGYVMAGYVPQQVIDYNANPAVTGGFWEVAAAAGVPSIVLDAAMAWDRPVVDGARVLAGLGVPDARGQNGDWFVYTDDPSESKPAPEGRGTSTAGTVFSVGEKDGRIESAIYGPVNFWRRDKIARELAEVKEAAADTSRGYQEVGELRQRQAELEKQARAARDEHMELSLVVEREQDKASVTIGGATQELAQGEWSSWYRLTFEVNPLIKAHAIARVKLVSLAEPFKLFVGILQIDPENPSFWQPISQPASFAPELAKMIGEPYETVGWACLSMPYKDAEIDEATFLEDIQYTQAWREKLTLACLERDDWRLLMSVESTPDRVQHMLYKYYDREHPMYDAAEAAREVRFYGETIPLSDAIPATYRQLDRFVGEVMDKHLRPGDTLIVCADHGFQPFRRQVHINNWLAENGYLALRPGLSSRDRSGLAFIDWSKTRAYSLALGMVYLNLKGREANGIVDPADAPALIAEIKAGLLAMQDEDGTPAMAEVYTTADVHNGPFLDLEADIMTGFARGYRVSWSTTLGGIRLELRDDGSYAAASPFDDNTNPWSGGHVSVGRSLVRGIFFCNRPLELPEGGVDLLHVAPTALDALGVAVPSEYDRPPLRLR